MKKILLFVAALFVAVSFSSCDKDDKDDNLPITTENLIGTRQITHSEGWEAYSDGTRKDYSDNYPDTSDENYYWTYTFDGNGTCVKESHADYHDAGSDYTDEYRYSISGNTLTMKGKTDSDLNFVGTIKKLTSSQLVLFSSGEIVGGGNSLSAKSEETSTYKRL